MTFLKKLGEIVAKVTGAFVGLQPVIKQFLPGSGGVVDVVSKDLVEVAEVIMTVEAIGAALSTPMPGAQKLQVATPLVAQVILHSSLLANHKIANEALFKQGAQKIADGMADVLNSLHEDGAKVEDKT